MLVCATLFWAGNFMVGKYAFLVEIPPLSLVFYRWSLVWIVLLCLAVLDILHVNVEKHVRQAVVNVKPVRTRVGAAFHARRAVHRICAG